MTGSTLYASSTEHPLAEAARVEMLLAVFALTAAQARDGARRAPSIDERVHALLDRASAGAPEPLPAEKAARAEASRMAAEIGRRRAESERRGVELRLAQLADRFGLGGVDVDLLLAALVPEMSARVARSTVETVLAALLPSVEAQLTARRRLSPGAPLLRHALLRFAGDADATRLPLPARTLEIDPRAAAFLFGDDAVDARIAPYTRVAAKEGSLEDLLMPDELKSGLLRAASSAGSSAPIVSLVGPYGAGKRALAAALSARVGRGVVTVDCAPLLATGDDAFATAS
jgi:hypothetical protein